MPSKTDYSGRRAETDKNSDREGRCEEIDSVLSRSSGAGRAAQDRLDVHRRLLWLQALECLGRRRTEASIVLVSLSRVYGSLMYQSGIHDGRLIVEKRASGTASGRRAGASGRALNCSICAAAREVPSGSFFKNPMRSIARHVRKLERESLFVSRARAREGFSGGGGPTESGLCAQGVGAIVACAGWP
ncbi:unnamed protein product, partial [Iphiclides podalirius]